MPVLHPIPPRELKDVLEGSGFKVIDESEHNWVLADDATSEPLVIPKHGRLVSVPVMDAALAKTRGKPAYKRLHEAVRRYVSR